MNSPVRLVLTLAVISLLSGLVLAGTYAVCSPLIEEQKQLRQREGIFAVVPDAANYREFVNDKYQIFEVFDEQGNLTGIAYVAEGGGFQGIIKMMVGLDPGTEAITGIRVLEHMETPGLGARITESWFEGQFAGKSISDPFQVKNDVEAISGATISSTAVANILKETSSEVLEIYRGGEGK